MHNDYKKYSKHKVDEIKQPAEEISEESITEEDNSDNVDSTPMGTVIPSRLYIRKGPGTNYEPITDISQGTDVLIVSGHDDNSTDWYEVMTAAGQEGFVMKEFIELNL